MAPRRTGGRPEASERSAVGPRRYSGERRDGGSRRERGRERTLDQACTRSSCLIHAKAAACIASPSPIAVAPAVEW
jgi:hypothetical protein